MKNKQIIKILICFFLLNITINNSAYNATKPIEPLVAYSSLNINNIYFASNSSNLDNKSKKLLLKLVNILDEFPNMEIEFHSNSDCKEFEKFGFKISKKRSKTIYKYLIKQGIKKNRLSYKNYGSERFVNACDCSSECSEKEYEMNRRVEFIILKM